MSLILQNIAKHIVLNREEESLFLSQLETHRFKANNFIIGRDNLQILYFTNSGIASFIKWKYSSNIH
jgi:hypothetical protein